MDKLHLMAEALLKYETIDHQQIQAIMEGRQPPPPADWHDDDQPPTTGKSETSDEEAGRESGSQTGKGSIGGPASQH